MSNKYDYIVVGSGIFGATFAYKAHENGKSVLVLEKRKTTGGNIHCDNIEGINVHTYGAHIFHTSDKEVWDFVNTLAPCNRYTNSPIARYKDELFNLPFNMNTFHALWNIRTPEEAIKKLNEQRNDAIASLYGREPENLEEQALTLVGHDIYKKLIKGYTEKQWGRNCTELPAFIIRRLPIRLTYDNNYFNDLYQGIPIGGYNVLIDNLLKDIEVITNTDYLKNREQWNNMANHVIYTGPIDAFYNYCYGTLQYRSLRFEQEVLDCPNFQGNAVVNYTDREVPYTRSIEHKHFEAFGTDVYKNPKTIISYEYSAEWELGKEPYYPINDKANSQLYNKYKELADTETHVTFGGRLAEYKYVDIHQIIRQVLDMWK